MKTFPLNSVITAIGTRADGWYATAGGEPVISGVTERQARAALKCYLAQHGSRLQAEKDREMRHSRPIPMDGQDFHHFGEC